MGKMPYGRRATEKIPGTRNEFHVVKQDEYSLYEGAHDAIIQKKILRWQNRSALVLELDLKKHIAWITNIFYQEY